MSEGVTRRSVLRGLGASLGGALIDQRAMAVSMRRVGTHSAELHLATPAPDILRIVFSPTGTLAIADDGVLEHTVGVPSGPPVSLADAQKTLSFGQFQVNIANDPVALRVATPAGHLIQ